MLPYLKFSSFTLAVLADPSGLSSGNHTDMNNTYRPEMKVTVSGGITRFCVLRHVTHVFAGSKQAETETYYYYMVVSNL